MKSAELGCRDAGRHRRACVGECAEAAGLQAGTLVSLGRGFRLMIALLVSLAATAIWTSVPGYGRQGRRSASLRRSAQRMLRALRVQVDVTGRPRSGACLVVANHQSWLDILVLTAAAPMIPVAKAEVFSWPLIGGIARRTGAISLRRGSWRSLPAVIDAMTIALRQGHRVQVFPEATTRCGGAVDQFYRAAFEAALNAAVVVQPATLSYRDLAGAPSRLAAFVGDTELVDSLRKVLRAPGLRVHLQWLPAIPAIAGTGHAATDRRAITQLTQNSVVRALGQEVVYRQVAQRPRKITSADSITNPGATALTSAESATGSTEA